jgi:dihydrofolate reductase
MTGEHALPRVTYAVAASLDGFIAGPNHELDWLEALGSPSDYGHDAFYAGVDALVMGRETFDVCRSMGGWPYAGKPCWVLTRGGPGPVPAEADVRITSKSPVDLLTEWQNAGLKHLWLVGGGQVATHFHAHGCLHELIVTTLPVTLGAGRPLWAPGPGFRPAPWRLLGVTPYPNGVVETRYTTAAAASK